MKKNQKNFLDSSNARLIGSDDEDDNAVERSLTLCRKVLIALLVFLGLLYYVTYEYDEVYYESQNGQVNSYRKITWKKISKKKFSKNF